MILVVLNFVSNFLLPQVTGDQDEPLFLLLNMVKTSYQLPNIIKLLSMLIMHFQLFIFLIIAPSFVP